MANFYGNGRTNYFRVKDLDAFRKAMERFGDITMHHPGGDGNRADSDKVCLLVEDADGYGDFPSYIYHEDANDDEEVDFPSLVAEHLADDEVAIFMHCGSEKLRYLSGYALAVTNDDTGEPQFISVSLDDIYKRVEDEWKIKPTTATY